MKPTAKSLLTALVLAAGAIGTATADPVFTYQGRLTEDGRPANGLYDMCWSLFKAPTDGIPFSMGMTNFNVPVVTGLLSVELDLDKLGPQPEPPDSPPAIDDDPTWLEIGVRRAGSTEPFNILSPRQRITSAPHAAYASVAAKLPDGALTAAMFGSNVVPSMALDVGAVTSDKIASGTVVRSVNGQRDDVLIVPGEGLGMSTDAGRIVFYELPGSCSKYKDCFWALEGNVVDDTKWLGTLNNWPLKMKVNSTDALRLEPTAGTANIVGGFGGNTASGATGVTISGGGGSGSIQSVASDWGAVGGGAANLIASRSPFSTISGGATNRVSADASASTVGGGQSNRIIDRAKESVIAGGAGNTIWSNAMQSVISGGSGNEIAVNAGSGAIAGGQGNRIQNGAYASALGGGVANAIQDYAYFSTISGGASNKVASLGDVIGGGRINAIRVDSVDSVIAGGVLNTIATNSPQSVIGGGRGNVVQPNSASATLGGGEGNVISQNSRQGTLGGGQFNTLDGLGATISGGAVNFMSNAPYATISGGATNTIRNTYATIGGGRLNSAFGEAATVAGGSANTANGTASTIGGGRENQASVSGGTIAGGASNWALGQFATVPGGTGARAQEYGQLAYASGSFGQVGDAQSSLFVLRATTTNATPTELFLDGGTARIGVSSRHTLTFEILITARSTTGNSAGYQIRGVIEALGGGGVAFVGTPLKTVLGEDVAGWDVNVEAASLALKINATGATGETIRWVVSVRTAEVAN